MQFLWRCCPGPAWLLRRYPAARVPLQGSFLPTSAENPNWSWYLWAHCLSFSASSEKNRCPWATFECWQPSRLTIFRSWSLCGRPHRSYCWIVPISSLFCICPTRRCPSWQAKTPTGFWWYGCYAGIRWLHSKPLFYFCRLPIRFCRSGLGQWWTWAGIPSYFYQFSFRLTPGS